MEDFGWQAHRDKGGTPCAYCGVPSTRTLIVVPDEYKEGQLTRRGIRVGLCDACQPEEAERHDTRRRHAKGVEQLALDTNDRRVE